MVYRAIGVFGNEKDTTITFAEFHENAGSWSYDILAWASYPGKTDPGIVTRFIEEKGLQFKAALITVHTISLTTSFNGAAIAIQTCLPVITDLAALDMELGGNGEFLTMAVQKLGMIKDELNDTDKAACTAFMGILRWREEYNFLSSITGASRNSIGGAIWLGQEA